MNGTQRERERHSLETLSTRPGTSLRQEVVEALALQRQLERRHLAARDLADCLEELAITSLPAGRDHVHALLDQRVEVLKQAESLAEQLREVSQRASRLKAGLLN